MASHLTALCVDANDPTRLARFWAGVLDLELAADGVTLLPSDDIGFGIRFRPTREPKVGPNQMHVHLTSTTLRDQQDTVDRVLRLGGRRIDVGQSPDDEHVVLADPEGNELCVIEPGNAFLAGCGFLGELTCDGSQETGYFWSRALGWPLVWDQDQETSIQSPRGGTKISWGGAPVAPRSGKSRLHLHLAPPVGGDRQAEVDRLVSLGATRDGSAECEADAIVMADPGGNEFCVVTLAGGHEPAESPGTEPSRDH
jgi:hypothetical protein